MFAALFNKKEVREIEYLIKRELESLHDDLRDLPLNPIVKKGMRERYEILFDVFQRFATPEECKKFFRYKRFELGE